MNITGIICEYDPFHLGHKKQLDHIRSADPEAGIVCLMSGNYVQRGKPAILDKQLRAQAAVLCGADLVLELPVTASLSSAEGFASQGVRLLGSFCQNLCFGAEHPDPELFMETAQVLLSDTFRQKLVEVLSEGLSFPAARQKALTALACPSSLLEEPNNILGVEYCKAIISQNSNMDPYPIQREGSYHASIPDPENPSATSIRTKMLAGLPWQDYIPEVAYPLFQSGSLHALFAGEGAILAKLRTMTEAEFQSLPFGSEGLWRKLMHCSRQESSLEDILSHTKSKRYTRSRLDRMVMCAFLGITEQDLSAPVPYARVLSFNERGKQILRIARCHGSYPNIGERQEHPYQLLENRASDLYGLFCLNGPEKPGMEAKRRVFYDRRIEDECK